jgi:hypothetical protein
MAPHFCQEVDEVSEIANNGTPMKNASTLYDHFNLDGLQFTDMDKLEFEDLLSCHSADYST